MAAEGSMSGIEVHFDFDGLVLEGLNPDYSDQEISARSYHGDSPRFAELEKSYYFEMRNGVAIFAAEGRDVNPSRLAECMHSIYQSLLRQAGMLAVREIETGNPAQPWWLDIFLEKFRAFMPGQAKELLEGVNFRVVHDGFLTAHADSSNTIHVSSKLRAFLNCFNVVVTSTELFGENPEMLKQFDFGDWYFDHLFPYFLQPEIGFDLMRLPIVMAPDIKRVVVAKRITEMQIAFLLFHELGHIALGHFDTKMEPRVVLKGFLEHGGVANHRLSQEFEADAFAALTLAQWPREAYYDFAGLGMEFTFSILNCMHETQIAVRHLLRPGFEAKDNVFAERRSILRLLTLGDGWVDTDLRGWGVMCHIFETLYLKKLNSLTLSQLESIILHRKGPHAR